MKRNVKLVIYILSVFALLVLSVGLRWFFDTSFALYIGVTITIIFSHFMYKFMFSKDISEKKAYDLLLHSIHLHEDNQTDKALEVVNDAINLAPYADELYFHRAIFKESLRDFKGAIEDFTKCIVINDRNGIVYYMRGTLLYLNDYNDDAYRDMNRAIDLKFEKPAVYSIRGWIHLERNEISSAIHDFNKAHELDPEDTENHFGLGLAFERIENYKSAITYFDLAINSNPQNSKYWVAKARSLFKAFDYDGCLETLNIAVSKGLNDLGVLYALGYVNYSLNGFDIALNIFKEVLTISPDNIDAQYFASVCLTESGQWSDALLQLNHTIELAPKLSRAYLLRAYIKNLLGDTIGSEEDMIRGKELENSV